MQSGSTSYMEERKGARSKRMGGREEWEVKRWIKEKSDRNGARGWEEERSGRSKGGLRKSLRGMEQEDGRKRGVGGQNVE